MDDRLLHRNLEKGTYEKGRMGQVYKLAATSDPEAPRIVMTCFHAQAVRFQ